MTQRLESHPCVLSVKEMGAARHFLRTTLASSSDEDKYNLLQSTLEINPRHPVIKKLHALKSSDPEIARLVSEQVRRQPVIPSWSGSFPNR